MLFPFLAMLAVVTPLRFENPTQSPAVGDDGRVSVRLAVITYTFDATAAVFVLITETFWRMAGEEDHAGADEPEDTKICPLVPADVDAYVVPSP